MLFFIVVVITFMLVFYFFRPFEDYILGIMIYAAITTFITLLFIISMTFFSSVQETGEKSSQNIVSMGMNTEISSSAFFLGSGIIDEESYYFCYIKIGNNTYKRGKFKTDNSIIKETNDKAPTVTIIFREKKLSDWIFPFGKEENKYIFYVPDNTIVRKFNIN